MAFAILLKCQRNANFLSGVCTDEQKCVNFDIVIKNVLEDAYLMKRFPGKGLNLHFKC